MRSRLGFYRFLVDLGDPFREIFGSIWIEKHDFFIFISRLLFLMIFGSESGCLGLENQAFGKGGVATNHFCRNRISQGLGVFFFIILGGLGTNFHDFCGTGEWLEI